MEDDTSNGIALEMLSNGKGEDPMAVVVDESSKSSCDGEECKEQVGGHLVAHEK